MATDYKAWMSGLNAASPRFLHSMVRIRDVDESMRFYVDGLGMSILGRFDVEERRVTALFLGFELGATAIELARYWDEDTPAPRGPDYFAIGVPCVATTFAHLCSLGAESMIAPSRVLEGWPLVAFVKDPDGYTIELIQTLEPVS